MAKTRPIASTFNKLPEDNPFPEAVECDKLSQGQGLLTFVSHQHNPGKRTPAYPPIVCLYGCHGRSLLSTFFAARVTLRISKETR
jgi:hypothetical protein